MIEKTPKKTKPAEESLLLRALWLGLAFICFYLVALVDPKIAHLSLSGCNLPLLFVFFWIGICGSSLSYYYRHRQIKWLELPGLAAVAMTAWWFVDNLQSQFAAGGEIDLLTPTLYLLVGMYVSHSFELRTRFDFNFSLAISVLVVCFASALGKGGWFGLGMFAYVVLSATLLLLDCEARTFGIVQARSFDHGYSYLSVDCRGSSEKTANLVVPTFLLLFLSICFFLTAPRAESLADQVASRVSAVVRRSLGRSRASADEVAQRLRSTREKSLEVRQAEAAPASNRGGAKPAQNSGASSGKSRNNQTVLRKANKQGVRRNAAGRIERAYSRFAEKTRRQTEAAQQPDSEPQLRQPSGTSGQSLEAGGERAPSAGLAEKNQATEAKPVLESNGGSETGNVGKGNKPEEAGATSSKTQMQTAGPGRKGTGDSSGKPSGKPSGKQSGARAEKASTAFLKKPVYFMPDTLDVGAAADRQETAIFSVSCDRTVYFRQSAFDLYDGNHWLVSPGLEKEELGCASNGRFKFAGVAALLLPENVPSIKLTEKFHLLQNLGNKLIFAGSPSEISAPGSAISIDACGNLKVGWTLSRGMDYCVYADEPMYDLKSMRAESVPSENEESALRGRLKRFLQVPPEQCDEFFELSRQVAGADDNWFMQAEKIRNHLQREYTYSVEPEYKRKSANSADHFLFQSRIGDCKDFATAFVLMCRASGIPARLVVGFSSGDFDPATGTRLVRLKNSHAWGEIYVPSAGWVPFDPTPQGFMPERPKEEERYFTTIGRHIEKSLQEDEKKGGSENSPSELNLTLPGGQIIKIKFGLWDLFKFIPLLILALILSGPPVIFLREAILRFRWPRRIHPASRIYLKARRDLNELGVARSESQTPGEFLALVSEKLSESDDPDGSQRLFTAVEDFISCYNACFFGSLGQLKELEEKRKEIRRLVRS